MYLLYTGSEPKDFEFKMEVKLDGATANSGMMLPCVIDPKRSVIEPCFKNLLEKPA